MFDSNNLLTKFGSGFWFRISGVRPGFYSFPKIVTVSASNSQAAVTSGLSDLQNHDGFRGDELLGSLFLLLLCTVYG